MPRPLLLRASLALYVATLAITPVVQAQESDETIIDTIRVRDSISDADRDRIGRWVSDRIDQLAAARDTERTERLVSFRDAFRAQYNDGRNTPEFRLQLASKTAQAAVERYGRSGLKPVVAHALARVLLDMSRVETVPGLLAGLKSSVPAARLLCARGLGALKAALVNDKPTQDSVIAALRDAGKAEKSAVVLRRIYSALAYPAQAVEVLPAYLDIFDTRLAQRRGTAVIADGGEIDAFEFFRTNGVIGALNQTQRADLALRLASFLRMDAERYASDEMAPPADPKTGDLEFYERDTIERLLVANEAILILLVPGQPDTIASALRDGGYDQRAQILARVYEWIGNPAGDVPGLLTPAPWNVPIGAP